ncbi:MAG: glycosyltransferase family 4 protein [Pyrinomonadaceae bacterium]|nr:glycosyltransferase family 4 protein [Pyrinomonadaceae bacterium]
MIYLATFIGLFLISWLLVGVFRKWSEGRAILDVPNERSSHDAPTPVGGGVVIVILSLVSLLIWELSDGGGVKFIGFYVGGLLIAGISGFDDLKHVPAPIRLFVHIIAALLVVFDAGSFEGIELLSGVEIDFGLFSGVITVFWIVWMTNAYNFMDGIDGIAGTQAALAAGFWALCSVYFGVADVTFLSVSLLATSLGFLLHNWPRARVFMGDVGSAFLGFAFASIPIYAISISESRVFVKYLPLLGLAALWFFFADTIVTFFRRLISGEKLWSAHRRHLYQELIKSGSSHLAVTGLYLILILAVCAVAIFEVITGMRGLILGIGLILFAGLFFYVSRASKMKAPEGSAT